MNERQPFSFSGETEIKGLTPEVTFALDDIVRKWGVVEPEDQMIWFRSGDIGLGHELIVRKPIDKNILFVYKRAIPRREIEIISTVDGVIYWETGLTAEEVVAAIDKVDRKAKEKGLIGPETSKRKSIPPEESLRNISLQPHYSVDQTFADPEYCIFLPVGVNIQKILREFDQPERLVVQVHRSWQMIHLR